MRLPSIIRHRLRTLFLRTLVERELDEELRYHLDRQIDENLARGLSPRDARLRALREFADYDQRKEECRDMRSLNFWDNLTQDLRFSLRQLGKNKGFTAAAILLPALGLCAAVAIFAFVDAALLKPLPYPYSSTLVGVYEYTPTCPKCNLSYQDYLDWKKMNTTFRSLDIYKNSGFIATTPSGSELVRATRVSAGFFRTLGVKPVLGRDFRDGEDLAGAPHTVMLTYATWRGRHGGDPGVIGRSITLDDAPYEIVGVLPRDFHFAPTGAAVYWTTLNPDGGCEKRRSCHNYYGVARLKDDASIDAARSDTAALAKRLEEQYPDSNKGQGANILPLSEVITGDIRPILLVLIGGAGLLLLIACVNVVSLLLARSEGRRRELALRGALGASRFRLLRQLMTESVVLVAAATLLGIASASYAMKLLVRLIPEGMLSRMPFLEGLGLNYRVAGFALGVALIAVVLFTLAPLVGLPFQQMREGLAEGGRGNAGNAWRRLGSRLVVVELAIAMVLLVGAGLLGQSLHRLLNVNLGFRPERLATLDVVMPDAAYSDEAKSIQAARGILERVAAMPGVEAVGTTSILPVSFNGNTNWIRFPGRPYNGEHNEILFRQVSTSYFAVIGAKLVRGRLFTDAEDSSKPRVTVINATLARKYFPGEDPIGKQFGNTALDPKSMRQIIGVVDDIRDGPLDSEVWPAEYRPYNQDTDTSFCLVVRAVQAPGSLLPPIAAAIREMDRSIVTLEGATMMAHIEDSPSAYMRRSSAWLLGVFAVVAMILGVTGLYGVIAYSVSQRTREIGVRMALGAGRESVYRLILSEAGWLAAIGIFAGIVAALAATRLLQKLLYGIQAWDVPTLVCVALLLGLATITASYLPARRAASVNPVDALRAE